MKDILSDKEIIDFLNKYEENQFDKSYILEFIMKLINGSIMLEKKLNSEIENLRNDLSIKSLEVSTLILNTIEKQEFLNLIGNGLNDLKKLDDGKNFKLISKLQNLLTNSTVFTEDSWNFFHNHFLSQHKVDLKKALNIYDLSDTEFKICSLIFLDFNSKDISKILNITKKSVDAQKYRIKKKIGIEKEEKLKDFICKIINI